MPVSPLRQPIVRTVLAISLGAIAGALTRYYVGQQLGRLWGNSIPYSTFVINVTGCFMVGFLVVFSLGQAVMLHPDLRLLLLNGFAGSYTTFATYEMESAQLLAQKNWTLELGYWGGTVVLGLVALQIGITSGEWVLQRLDREPLP